MFYRFINIVAAEWTDVLRAQEFSLMQGTPRPAHDGLGVIDILGMIAHAGVL